LNVNDNENRQTQNFNNPRSKLRLLIELFSLMISFLIMGLISLSVAFSTEPGKINIYSFSFTLPYNKYVLIILGFILIIASLISIFLMLFLKQAEQFGRWLEYSDSKLNKLVWRIFWPLLWISLCITFIEAIVEISTKMSTPFWRSAALIGGISLFIIAFIILLIKIPPKRKQETNVDIPPKIEKPTLKDIALFGLFVAMIIFLQKHFRNIKNENIKVGIINIQKRGNSIS